MITLRPPESSIQAHRLRTGIALEIHRPEKLGALDTECFQRIEEILEQAREDSQCAWIAFFSRNPKAFCAGGDVRRLFEDYLRTKSFDLAEKFFETEYRVDQKVWDFPKPILAFTHGITMGGGIGLIRGASHRVVTPSSMLAMPEVSIGLYPDVGATYFLQRIPNVERKAIAFCAARFGAAAALDWGLATHCLSQNSRLDTLPALLESLDQVRWEGSPHDIATASKLLDRYSTPPPVTPEKIPKALGELFQRATDVDSLWKSAKALRTSNAEPACNPLLDAMLQGSPLSVAIIWEQLERGARLSRTQAFEWEFHLSMSCLRQGDFFEGVRSRLVEKGSAACWRYPTPGEVPTPVLHSILG